MQLTLCPLQLEDFDEIESHASSYPPGDDLVGQPTPICCAVTTKGEAEARLKFHFQKQRKRFTGDPTVRYVKVIDSASKSIISIARWHFYAQGYNFDDEIHWELHDPADGVPAPLQFNVPLHNHILRIRDAARSSWIPPDSPCWILMHMVTHPAHRGKGAAGLLIKWGIEQAHKGRVPAFLEAGVAGQPIYERYGFVQVGAPLEVNLKAFDMDMIFKMCTMGYFP